MTNEQYNGWTNRETWLTNLWLTNDQGIYEYVVESLQQNPPGRTPAVETLRRIVEELVAPTEQVGDWTVIRQAGLREDFLGQCVARVNYDEILEGFQDEL